MARKIPILTFMFTAHAILRTPVKNTPKSYNVRLNFELHSFKMIHRQPDWELKAKFVGVSFKVLSLKGGQTGKWFMCLG